MEVTVLEIKLVSITHAVYTFGHYKPVGNEAVAMIRLEIHPTLRVGQTVTVGVDC